VGSFLRRRACTLERFVAQARSRFGEARQGRKGRAMDLHKSYPLYGDFYFCIDFRFTIGNLRICCARRSFSEVGLICGDRQLFLWQQIKFSQSDTMVKKNGRLNCWLTYDWILCELNLDNYYEYSYWEN